MKKVLLFLILMICLSLFGNIKLENTTISPQSYNIMYPTYFDPNHPENQPIIFNIEVTENPDPIPSEFYFKFNMEWRGESLVNDGAIKVDGFLGGFISNREMIDDSNTMFVSEGFSWEDILTNNADFQDQILQTGRMPDGQYLLSLEAFDDYNNGAFGLSISNTETISIDILAPTSITLISPGTPLGLGSMSIHDMYPTFVWYSDMNDYTVSLYELTDEYITQEEIEYLNSLWTEPVIAGTNLPFPAAYSGLSENKIYAWQVSAGINSPYNPDGIPETYLKSDVYIFNTFTDNVTDMDTQVLLNFLYQLNLSGIDDIIRLLESGYGFDTIVWDGREVRLEELREILEKYLAGEINVKSLSVE